MGNFKTFMLSSYDFNRMLRNNKFVVISSPLDPPIHLYRNFFHPPINSFLKMCITLKKGGSLYKSFKQLRHHVKSLLLSIFLSLSLFKQANLKTDRLTSCNNCMRQHLLRRGQLNFLLYGSTLLFGKWKYLTYKH